MKGQSTEPPQFSEFVFLGRVIARLFIDSEICLKILDWDLILSVYVSAQHNLRPHRTGRFEKKIFLSIL